MVNCLLCKSSKQLPIYQNSSWSVVRCTNCGLVRTETNSKINYQKYHRDNEYHIEEKLFENIFSQRYKIIKKHVPKKGKVLDIGASTGVFLSIFVKNGWEVVGIEPSESARIAQEKGLDIRNVTFEKANLPSAYFDLVIMNHTLEHIADPVAVLNKIHKVLKKGGILYVDVPNFASLRSKIWKARWSSLLPQEHLSQFEKNSLQKLFTMTNFKILEVKSRSGLFEFAHPFNELLFALLSFKKRFFSEIWSLPISFIATITNHGDSITFIGRKI